MPRYVEVMAITNIKATYSLTAETTRNLRLLAKFWGVAKSAALRRVIDERLHQERATLSAPGNAKLEAIDWLRKHRLSRVKAQEWKADVRISRENADRRSASKWKHTTSTRIS